MPITLHRSRATNQNMCDMWNRLGAIGILCNGLTNSKAETMCWYSNTNAMQGIGCPPRICLFWRHIGPIETLFIARSFLCQGRDERRWIWPTTRSCKDGRSWMTYDLWQIINPATAYGRTCYVAWFDNKLNHRLWWREMPKVLHQSEHKHGTHAKSHIPKLPHNM